MSETTGWRAGGRTDVLGHRREREKRLEETIIISPRSSQLSVGRKELKGKIRIKKGRRLSRRKGEREWKGTFICLDHLSVVPPTMGRTTAARGTQHNRTNTRRIFSLSLCTVCVHAPSVVVRPALTWPRPPPLLMVEHERDTHNSPVSFTIAT